MSSSIYHLDDVSFRDRIPTVTAKGKRRWMYVWKPLHGKLYNIRSIISFFYVCVFFSLPFIKIKGNPILQLNVVEGKFSILGMIFWPQDFFIFGIGMVTFIVFIVLFTMIYGRVFCGWVCPQTIFMEMIFRRIERWIEGNPNQQKMLREGGWSNKKIIRKGLKHIAFLSLSFLIANTFLAYIIGIDNLFKIIREPVSMHVGGFTAIIVFTLIFYGVYAYVRELVCTIVCPYGRLQGVLLDKNSVIVAYDYNRGEPRHKGKHAPEEQVGDCIDCNQCLVVCPTGIDIRNGTQLECINCTACIDACNHIMEKIKKPKGLIRYASENQLAQKAPFKFTIKMGIYSGILLLLMSFMSFLLITRTDIDVSILRAKGQLFQDVGKDSISNLYNLNLTNKTHQDVPFSLKIENMKGAIQYIGHQQMVVPSENQFAATFFLIVNKRELKQRETQIKIGVYENGKKIKTVKTSFLGYIE